MKSGYDRHKHILFNEVEKILEESNITLEDFGLICLASMFYQNGAPRDFIPTNLRNIAENKIQDLKLILSEGVDLEFFEYKGAVYRKIGYNQSTRLKVPSSGEWVAATTYKKVDPSDLIRDQVYIRSDESFYKFKKVEDNGLS